jgi:1-acyl-sn-glycerol-3-phosphate acyltransferase
VADAAIGGISAPESIAVRWLRRCGTILAVHSLLLLLLLTAPVWLPGLALFGLFQKGSFPALRCFLFLTWLMAFECAGVMGAFVIWLRPRGSRELWLARHYALQRFWVTSLFRGARIFLGIRLRVEGGEALARGRVLLLIRHASVVDALLPDLVAVSPHGLRLRYVIKRELRIDPCLDIVGDRLPNAFVRRGSGDSASEIARVKALAEDLSPRDGVILFPEGTRFTHERKNKILDRLQASGESERYASAAALKSVLPLRLGGIVGLLETDPEADLVFCAHTGTERLTRLGDLWSGAAQGALLQVGCWRVPAREIPREEAARNSWLEAQWRRIDSWVEGHEGPAV